MVDKSKHSNININKYDEIITQNIANLFIYNNYIEDKNKITITPLPDFKNSKDLINTSNSKIIVGIIGDIHYCKGKIELEQIINYYKNSNIEIIIFGKIFDMKSFNNFYPYKDVNELNELLITHKPNVLIELSIWHETYSYTLTLAMITHLPILYLKKNGYSVVEYRLSNYDKSFSFTSIDELNNLINSKKQDYFYTIEPVIYFNEAWDNYFITKKEKKAIAKCKNRYDIKPYVIYFPQFHEIIENNISFYPEFSDIKNLDLLSKSDMFIDIETPSLKEFNLQNITEYDYMNKKSILQKQIDIIDEYNISGLAIYYYWFSANTITNQNLIMENVTNQFFNGSVDMKNKKCFLIWANESWTNNPAFGTTNERIETDYTNSETYENISENLLTYFKNDTYLKIDNKPVFELHHPWFMSEEQIDVFYNVINNKCIQNNFGGIQFIVNSINGNYNKYINRAHHFNYKKSESCFFDSKYNNLLDYKKYIKNDIKENIDGVETIVFDFDNRARLFKPNKLCKSTTCTNNTEIDKIIFIEKIINKYNKDKQSNITNMLLVNSWNEWGEKMAIEPSEEYGFYYLNLLNERLEFNNKIKLNNYPSLFHKYINNLSSIDDNIDFEVINNYELCGNILTHIHCYNLNYFEDIFGYYLNKIPTSIIVTFSNCENYENIINKYSNIAQFLKIKNKGMDIGGKICCLQYLYQKQYNFEYILFIHSKTDLTARRKYIEPLLNINFKEILSYNNNILGIFPNLLVQNNESAFFGTIDYRNEILDYLNCKNKENIFIESNFCILKKNVIDFIFEKNLQIFYNILNDFNSFDVNWFNKYYFFDRNITNKDAFQLYNQNDYKYVNMYQPNLENDREMRDCMIEHVFERIWLNIILHLKGEYIIAQNC
jgi:hypothetical protein